MVEGFKKEGKFRPFGRSNNGVSEKEFENVSRDFIKVPHDHVFNKAIRNSEKNLSKPWKMLSEEERKILIPRIWNETLTLEQRRAAIDQIIKRWNYGYKNDHWYDVVHKGERNKFENLPKELQEHLLEIYKYRTTLEYD